MRATWLCAAMSVAACSTSRGPVEVYAFGYAAGQSFGVGPPLAGAQVVFEDRDGTARAATTDSTGYAHGEVEPGGTVWCSPNGPFRAQDTNSVVAIEDVQTPATLVFGAPPAQHAAIASIMVSAQLPAPPPPPESAWIDVYTPCSAPAQLMGSTSMPIQLDDRCSGTVDIYLAVETSYMATDVLGPYASMPSQAIVDGETITLPADAWTTSTQTVTVQFDNSDGATIQGSVADSLGLSARAQQPAMTTGTTTTAPIPIITSTLDVGAALTMGSASSSSTVAVAGAATLDVDLHAIAAPYLIRDPTESTWTTDDRGGALVANGMIRSYNWQDPNVQYQQGVTATIIGPPAASGTIPAIALPGPMKGAQPSSYLIVNTQIALARFQVAGVDPLQAATLGTPPLQPGDSASTSLAP